MNITIISITNVRKCVMGATPVTSQLQLVCSGGHGKAIQQSIPLVPLFVHVSIDLSGRAIGLEVKNVCLSPHSHLYFVHCKQLMLW